MRLLYIVFILSFAVGTLQAQSDNSQAEYAIGTVNKVEQSGKIVTTLSVEDLNSLPIGIIKKIGNTKYIIAIDSAWFFPDGAYFNAYMAVALPESDKRIAFGAKRIKFNPSGVVSSELARLVLLSSIPIKMGPSLTLNLLTNGYNYVDWDCNGFKSVRLNGEFVFGENLLIPEPATNKKNVTATFDVLLNDLHNFVTKVDITPFILKGLKNFSFEVKDAVVDMSETNNYNAMLFPPNYYATNKNTVLWKGFYIREMTVTLPPEISPTTKRAEIQGNHLLIDNTGFSGMVQANNVFDISQGSMSGWKFSLEELGIGFLSNKVNSGHLKGKIEIPTLENNGIVYTADLFQEANQEEVNYAFTIEPAKNLTMSAFNAHININTSSQITVVKYNSTFKPLAILNGDITFSNQKFISHQLQFERLTITDQLPYITDCIINFTANDSTQTKAIKYPISIHNFTLMIQQSIPSFGVGFGLNLNDQGSFQLGAACSLAIRTKVNPSNRLAFDKITFSGINIENATSVYSLKGYIDFRDNHPVYGDGFSGGIAFGVQGLFEPFGANTMFGTKDDFRYWYVDLNMPVNLPIAGGAVFIDKLLGGAYSKMKGAKNEFSTRKAELTQIPNPQNVSQYYTPDKNMAMGFKVGIGYNLAKSDKLGNGEAILEIAFTSSGGIKNIQLTGNVNILSSRNERLAGKAAPINGNVTINYDIPSKVFDLNSKVNLSTPTGISGSSTLNLHTDPSVWFVKFGTPGSPMAINVHPLGNVTAYLMIGNSLPAASNFPNVVSGLVSKYNLDKQRNVTDLTEGKRFALGLRGEANKYWEKELKLFTAYANLHALAGFDLMISDYGKSARCSGSSENVGLDGYYADGSFYGYISAEVGGRGKKRTVTVAELAAAAVLSGSGPRPTYLNGVIQVSYEFIDVCRGRLDVDFNLGERCSIVQ